jgi:GAF domain-containing protein
MSFVQYVGALADQIAVAIENRYLFEESQAEARRNRALADAARISSQIGVDFATGVTNLIESVAKSANYDRWWYGQVIASGAIVGLSRVSASFPVGSPLRDLEQIALSTTKNTIAEAARGGDGLLVNDPSSPPDHLSQAGRGSGTGKHIAVPVKVGAIWSVRLWWAAPLVSPTLMIETCSL